MIDSSNTSNLFNEKTRAHSVRTVIAFSIAVTTIAAPIAYMVSLTTSAEFFLTFVFLRWGVVALLILTPIVALVVSRFASVKLPWVFRTPLTALFLTFESIVVDILSARLV